MASSSSPLSSPSSSSSPSWIHDVYPSYCAEDIGKVFLRHSLRELMRKGIVPFNDNGMGRSRSILTEAIRASRTAVVVLSRKYASSSWCLDELVEIIKCRDELGQAVVPVFYELDQNDVMELTGDFGELFRTTCMGKTKEETDRWRHALEMVAAIPGYHSRSWARERDMIEKLATKIADSLNNSTPSSDIANRSNHYVRSSDFESLVGMRAHLEKMKPLLSLDSDEVRMIGNLGPAGIGKSTIARFLFSKHSHDFQLSVFMENIKRPYDDEYSMKQQFQKEFLSQLINQGDIKIQHLGVVPDRLKDRRVLVDVDQLGQLEALAKQTWFGPRSRTIITTQDRRLLKAHGIKRLYKVDLPSPDEAHEIFCMDVFRQKSPYIGFEKLAREVITLSGGHPRVLRFMGSYFRGKSKKEWEIELPKLRTRVDGKLGSIRDFTYDSLCSEDKKKVDCELNEKVDGFHSEHSKQMLGRIITNHDVKEDFNTNERAFKGIPNGLPHTVYIYCADTLLYSFASHLSVDFRRKRIAAFVNCNSALDVLQGASAYVVVLSKNYLSSTSCLDKLVTVLQCRRKSGQLVVPVYYGISPSDVAVPEHASADRIRGWSSALKELRELPSHQFREECRECKLVEEIVKDVYEKLFPTEQIGINLRLLEIEQLLCKQPWGIRRLGIWGMPGIGKTTLAKAFFDQIAGGYEASCFIKHFEKDFHEKGFHLMLEEHFGRTLEELPRVCSSITRPSLPGDKLSKKRTLIVLDDVENALTAQSFLGEIHWFGPGSLIIITSRDKQVFRLCQINHVYQVQSLNDNEALQLFSQCAFGENIREENLLRLSMEVIDYANGNPLAVSFYGRELKGKKLSKMETTFLKLKLSTPYNDLFYSSYKTLDDNEKNIFLDIACFFNGANVDYVMQLLEGCGFFPHIGIDVLVEKCLVSISENRVIMHSIIQDFGREIINRESVQIERRRRLWEPRTIKFLLEDDKLEATCKRVLGTEDIEGIFLDTSNFHFDVNPTAFENMINLRFLKIYCSIHANQYGLGLPRGLESLPHELRLLHWENYPLQSLPQDFDPGHLVELNMSYSQLQTLWRGTKNLDMLKMVRLRHSQQLTEIGDICIAQNIELIDLKGSTKLQSFPATGQLQHLRVVNLSGCKEIRSFSEVSPNIEELDLRGTSIRDLPISIGNATNLKKLYLTGCVSLVELPSSIGNATNLEILDLSSCSSLMELPSSIGNVTNLEILNLEYCSNLVELPSSIGNATHLKKLCLTGCSSLVELPSSIGNATNLEILNLEYCSSLVELPSSIGNATTLKLCLTGCSSLVELPSSIGNATHLGILDLSNCSSLVELPSSIGNVTNLEILNLGYCSSLVELPSSIGNATNLEILNLEYCSSLLVLPSSISNATNLKKLYLTGCSSLVKLPSSIGNATNLEILNLEYCSSLVELPSSIGNTTNLEILNLEYCSNLVELPPSIGNAIHLKKLCLTGCSNLMKLPSSIGNATNLEILNLEYCSSLVELPSSIGNATNLKKLCLTGCASLVTLPSSIGNATNLEILNLGYCSSLVKLPSSIGNATNLKKLCLIECSSLVEIPSSIRNATNLMVELPSSFDSTSPVSIDLDEDNSLPVVTVSSSGSRCIKVRRERRGKFYVLKGELKDIKHPVSLIFVVDENGCANSISFPFYQESDTASKVSSEMVEELEFTNLDVTFIAELIDIVLVSLIPTWKPDVTFEHFIDSQFNQNSGSHQKEAKTHRQEVTVFNNVSASATQVRQTDNMFLDFSPYE